MCDAIDLELTRAYCALMERASHSPSWSSEFVALSQAFTAHVLAVRPLLPTDAKVLQITDGRDRRG